MESLTEAGKKGKGYFGISGAASCGSGTTSAANASTPATPTNARGNVWPGSP